MLLCGKDLAPEGALCSGCSLGGFPVVCGDGPSGARLFILGEAPGWTEPRTGIPFSGPSGKLLNKALAEVGIDRAEAYVTNVCLCAPSPTRPPKPKEVKACAGRLALDLQRQKPKVVLALGNTALKAMTGNNSIAHWRGSVLQPKESTYFVVPTYHPAAVLRSPRLHKEFVTDLHKVKEVLQEGFVNKSVATSIRVDVVEETEQLHSLLNFLNRKVKIPVSLDVETTSTGELLSIGLAWHERHAITIPQHILKDPVAKELLNYILASVVLVGHNLKFDLQVLWENGLTGTTGGDSMLQHYMTNEVPGTHSLRSLAKEFLGMPEYEADLKDFYKKGLENCPEQYLWECNGKHAAYSLILFNVLHSKLTKEQQQLLDNLLYHASDVLARMEQRGITIDTKHLQDLHEQFKNIIDSTKLEMYAVAGKVFNPNSHKQLTQLLFQDLEIPIPGRISTDKMALSFIQDCHPLIPMLQKYRKYDKLQSNFIRGLQRAITKQGKVHTTFNLHGTVTGRLSSSNPLNLQNIPRDPEIRKLFVASPGYLLVEADLSQAEIRALAWYSKDKTLLEALISGQDLHIRTATLMFGVQAKDVTPKLREAAKRLTFGQVYQMSPEALADELKVSKAEAEDLTFKFFEAYPQVREWIKHTQKEALEKGYVVSAHGRVRRFGVITKETRADVLRQAVNAPVQAMATDINLQALITLGQLWKNNKSTHLLLTVHDANMAETTEETLEETAKTMHQVMSAPVLDNTVPFVANVKYGKSWGELKEFTFK